MKKLLYIYGPVSSWRLGRSLGIDMVKGAKRCNFDCVYCQIGPSARYALRRRVFVPTGRIIKELASLPHVAIDYITFSGMGEPTLASNLGDAIRKVKSMRKEPVAVLTNSLLLGRKDVKRDLSCADFVVAKLDAFSDRSFCDINRPGVKTAFSRIIKGLILFRKDYQGKFALQIMFTRQNRRNAHKLAELSKKIDPDEVQINTPLRPSRTNALGPDEIAKIKRSFHGMNAVTVYDSRRKRVAPLNAKDIFIRRGTPT